MTALEDELRNALRIRAQALRVPERPALDRDIVEPDRRPWSRLLAAAACLALAIAGVVAIAQRRAGDPAPAAPVASVLPDTTTPVPSVAPTASPDTTTVAGEPSPRLSGTWIATDVVYNAREMDLVVSEAGSAQLSVHENFSTSCGGGATMTWTGAHGSGGELVFATYAETCGEESEPIRSGEGGTYTLAYDNESDTLTDNLGVVWWRKGADNPGLGGMWPQATPGEVQEAQELADAGDPAYAWQIDPGPALSPPGGPEIAQRFLREKLGWEEFLINQYDVGYGGVYSSGGESWIALQYLRCAPGETNPIYLVEENAEYGHACAPTLDEYHYEMVRLDVSQFGGQRPDGIWVVSRWSTTTAPPFEQADPNAAEAAATAQLEEFLRARLSGEGAEGLIEVVGDLGGEIPLLYATTSGAPYERYELERVRGPEWPHGDTRFMVRLFADDGATVVEQQIDWRRDWRTDFPGCCEQLLAYERNKTTENGEPPVVP